MLSLCIALYRYMTSRYKDTEYRDAQEQPILAACLVHICILKLQNKITSTMATLKCQTHFCKIYNTSQVQTYQYIHPETSLNVISVQEW